MSAAEGGDVRVTEYFPLDSTNSDEFILVGKRGKAVNWLNRDNADKCGVMIAGNFGRPGGACIDKNGRWKDHTRSKTHEESVLSFFANDNETIQTQIVKTLTEGTIGNQYRMALPRGDQRDFMVCDGTDEHGGNWVNIQTAGDELYRREYGFDIVGYKSEQGNDKAIYLSFIAGPNAATQEHPWPDPRQSDTLDSMYRCASLKASAKYHVFKRMVGTALRASLEKMIEKKLDRVIIAGLSCGIYADEFTYRPKIRREYPELCREVIAALYLEHTHRFTHVLRGYFWLQVESCGNCFPSCRLMWFRTLKNCF